MSREVFEYALLRVVPRIERGELLNVGVIVYSQAHDYLDLRTHFDEARLLALAPTLDVDAVRAALDAQAQVCRGDPTAGEVAKLSQGKRFRWLTSPRSTVVQAGPVHSGMTADPSAELVRLLDRLVRS
jgi:Protein of unknown function (DUF3037)